MSKVSKEEQNNFLIDCMTGSADLELINVLQLRIFTTQYYTKLLFIMMVWLNLVSNKFPFFGQV